MKAFKISAILSLIIAAVGLAGVVLLGNFQGYVQLLGGLLWFGITAVRIRKGMPLKGKVSDYLAGRILVFILFLFFGVAIVSPITKGYAFQYPIQMDYLNSRGYQNVFFPQRLPESVEDYSMDFMPSILQGSGWTNVSFKTDPATLAQYRNAMEERGCKAEMLADHECLELLERHLPDAMKKNQQMCRIYILRFQDDWNHPHLECMVVYEEQGYMMFFEE